MPTITLKADWARGPIVPVRVSVLGRRPIWARGAVGISDYETLISSYLAERLGSTSIGMARPVDYIRNTHLSPAHKITIEVVAGGLGRPMFRHCLHDIIAIEANLSVDLVVGCQILSKGNMAINSRAFSFCL